MNHPDFAIEGITSEFSEVDLKVQNRYLNHTNDSELFHVVTEESVNENPFQSPSQQTNIKGASDPVTYSTINSKSSSIAKKQLLEGPSENLRKDRTSGGVTGTQQAYGSSNSNYLSVGQKPREKKKSTRYQEKVDLFHLAGASQIRPSIFISESNDIAAPRNDSFMIKAHQPAKEYNPHDQHVRTHKLKNDDNRYISKKNVKQEVPITEEQVSVSSNKKQVKRLPSMSQNKKSDKFMSISDSSTITLQSSKTKPINENIDSLHLQRQNIEETLNKILQPTGQRTSYELIRQQSFGVNYIHPDFKIVGNEGVLVSAKKQSFHFNSCYNLTVGTFGSELILGCLRGNFGGNEFNLYRFHEEEEELVATITYQTNFACGPDCRSMEVYVKVTRQNDLEFLAESRKKNLKQLYQEGFNAQVQRLVTKEPIWNEKSQCYTLSFGGSGKLASTKNMILVPENSPRQRSLLFCKTDTDRFHLQTNDMSLFTAMGILMSSFDFKIFCQ